VTGLAHRYRNRKSRGVEELAKTLADSQHQLPMQSRVAAGAHGIVAALSAQRRTGEASQVHSVVIVAGRAVAQSASQEAMCGDRALEAGSGSSAVLAVVGTGLANGVGAVVVEPEGAVALGVVHVPIHVGVAQGALRGSSDTLLAQYPALQTVPRVRVLVVVADTGAAVVG